MIEAGSGGAALEHLGTRRPHIDLMIADLAMPGMNGLELARVARLATGPMLPILFVTGFADLAASREEAATGPAAAETVPRRGTRARRCEGALAQPSLAQPLAEP